MAKFSLAEPGDKSEVLDIDNPDLQRFPDFTKAVPYECVLHPGDVLFIPGDTLHVSISSVRTDKT